MDQSIFDDGSTLSYDGDGNLIAATDSSGAPYPVPGVNGSAIVQQFANLFNYGARAAIDSRFRQRAAAPAGAPAVASSTRNVFALALLALGALLALKALK